MSLPINIGEIIKKLVLTRESEHFLIHYEVRNPIAGRGLGPHGVRDHQLISTYLEALELLYRTMTADPWNRSPPIVGPDSKTHVYVFNSGGPFTTYDADKIPYIVLTSRNNEPRTEAELHRAASEAIHEATHLFNYTQRPLHDKINASRWEWFDEGLAVLMEMLIYEDNFDHFRFLMDWVDSPEMSLDHPAGQYQAGMFLHYVKDKVSLKFINDVWLNSKTGEEPLQALERLMPGGQKFFSSDSEVPDIFASGYCIDPYYLWEHATEVFSRFGERAVSESVSLPDENGRVITDHLNHLACRYYRFYVNSEANSFAVTMNVNGDGLNTPLKAQVGILTKDRGKLTPQSLKPRPKAPNGDATFECLLSPLNADEIDHVVLVVSNCGTNMTENGELVDHDGREFTIVGRVY